MRSREETHNTKVVGKRKETCDCCWKVFCPPTYFGTRQCKSRVLIKPTKPIGPFLIFNFLKIIFSSLNHQNTSE